MKVTRIFDIPHYQKANHPNKRAFANKRNNNWLDISIDDVIQNMNNLSYGLLASGVKPGDKIVTISTTNRFEWNYMDFAILQIGAINVPVYPTISPADYEYIFNNSEVKMVFVSDAELLKKVNEVKHKVPTLEKVYSFDEIEGCANYKELIALGENNVNSVTLNELKDGIKDTDLATLIYTSGTTGKPKGVMLSHKNIVSNVVSGAKLLPVDNTTWALSFLPMCHVFERTVVYIYIYGGVSVYYAESLETIGDNIKEVHPHMFTAVPRLIEKVYDKIVAKGNEPGGIKSKIFNWAIKVSEGYNIKEEFSFGYAIKYKIAKKLVYSKIKNNLDPNLKCIVSGSAALQARLARFFWAIDMPILEGYGLTETSPIISVNNYDRDKVMFGSVGVLLEDVNVNIAEDGEIIVKGPNVMMGYYKNQSATDEVIDKEGWFHTGDIGKFEGKFLRITGRKKEIFKTSGGKYVAPQPIENKMKESPFIEQIMVVGEGEKHASALIVPCFEYIKQYCSTNGINFTDNANMSKHPEIVKALEKDVARLNLNFGKTEQIKNVKILDCDWTIESGELTPTMKVKRKVVAEKYQNIIDSIYR